MILCYRSSSRLAEGLTFHVIRSGAVYMSFVYSYLILTAACIMSAPGRIANEQYLFT